MRTRRYKVVGGLAAAATLALGGTAIAQGTGNVERPEQESGMDERDELVTGSAAEKARAAGIRAVGGGQASVERDGDNAYEVEVTRADGTTVDVDLDESFNVVPDREDGDREESD
jgi:hypothetical protein